jgi:putative membrane protein
MNRAIWVSVFLVVLIWSGIGPKDYPTWFLEVFPALLGGAMLWYTRDIFPLTRLVYILVLFHCIILMVGGHYTYAEVPLFDWLKEQLDLTRNNYDKVGHFVQGFVPAMVARNGSWRLRPKRPPTRFSEPRVTSGIHSPTWRMR